MAEWFNLSLDIIILLSHAGCPIRGLGILTLMAYFFIFLTSIITDAFLLIKRNNEKRYFFWYLIGSFIIYYNQLYLKWINILAHLTNRNASNIDSLYKKTMNKKTCILFIQNFEHKEYENLLFFVFLFSWS